MSKTTNTWRGAITSSLVTLVMLLAAGLVVALIVVPRALGGASLTVLSGSMEPGIMPGDVVVTRGVDETRMAALKVGDVITLSGIYINTNTVHPKAYVTDGVSILLFNEFDITCPVTVQCGSGGHKVLWDAVENAVNYTYKVDITVYGITTNLVESTTTSGTSFTLPVVNEGSSLTVTVTANGPANTAEVVKTISLAAPFTLGDVNGDGKINAIDASLILQHDAKINILEGPALLAADVNGDGKANAIDASMILQFDAKLITSFK